MVIRRCSIRIFCVGRCFLGEREGDRADRVDRLLALLNGNKAKIADIDQRELQFDDRLHELEQAKQKPRTMVNDAKRISGSRHCASQAYALRTWCLASSLGAPHTLYLPRASSIHVTESCCLALPCPPICSVDISSLRTSRHLHRRHSFRSLRDGVSLAAYLDSWFS